VRKPRILIISLAVCLATLLIGSWWKKDIVASQLINLFAGEVVIQQLTGLELGFREVSIEKVQLKSSRDYSLVLAKVKIFYPFHIIYDRDNTQKIKVSVDKIIRYQDKDIETARKAASLDSPEIENSISLSGMIQDIVRYMPGSISVREVVLSKHFTAGPLDITRQDTTLHVNSPYKSTQFGEFYFSLQANLIKDQTTVIANIVSTPDAAPTQVEIKLLKGKQDQWKLNASINSSLEAIDPILGATQTQFAASPDRFNANGHLSAHASALIPDNFLSLADYQNTVLRVESDALEFSIASEIFNDTVSAQLSTQSPIELRIKALSPFLLESVTGSGSISAISGSDTVSKSPLAEIAFESVSQTNTPKLQVDGSIYLPALEPVLQSSRWKTYFPALQLTKPKGELKFQGEAALSPIGAHSTEKNWLDTFSLALLSGSELQFEAAVTDLQKESHLHSLGLHQSQVKVNIRNKIQIEGRSASPHSFEVIVTDGAFDSELQAMDSTTSIYSKVSQLQCSTDKANECVFDLETVGATIADEVLDITLNKLDSTARVYIQAGSNIQQLKLEQVNATFEALKGRDFKIDRGEFQLPQIDCKIGSQSTSCSIEKWDNQFKALTSEYFTLSGKLNFSNINLRATQGDAELGGNFSSSTLGIETAENYSLEASLTGSLSLSGDKIKGQSKLRASSLIVDSSWHHDIDLATGAIQFSLPGVEFSSRTPLSRMIKGLPVDIVSGGISANGTISWPQQPKDSIHLALANVAAIYGDSFATGIEGEIQLVSDNGHWLTSKPHPLLIQSIDAGLPLNDVHFSLSLDREKDLILENFSAEFLNGKLSSEALSWNLAHKERSSILYAQDISLEQLAHETESENFKASGRLNLTIPVSTGPDGITVKNGHLQAIEPGGQLRYYGAFSPQVLAGNPQLKLIANALEDYNFRTLEGSMEYPSSGDLLLNLKLVGRSESVDTDRDLIINLNLENNIPSMLRSLQASRDLTEALEKQLDQ